MTRCRTGWRLAAVSACMFAALGIGNVRMAYGQDAAGYPSRNITWVVGFPPGGPPDTVARVVGPALSELLGKPVVVENRPGASGSIAATQVARAAADGHVIGSYDPSVIVAPLILVNAGFDPDKDFQPVVFAARTSIAAVVSPSLGVKSVAELVALARQKPGDIKIGHSGIGTPPHLSAVAFLQATRTDMLLVPYRGAALALQDVVAGHVSMLFTGPSTSIGLVKEGKAIMVGVAGRERLKSIPEVPTFAESGVAIAGFDEGQWFGVMVPAGTPAAIVARLNSVINTALSRADVQERFAKVEFTTVGGTAEEMKRLGQSQSAFWRDTLKAAGVKPE